MLLAPAEGVAAGDRPWLARAGAGRAHLCGGWEESSRVLQKCGSGRTFEALLPPSAPPGAGAPYPLVSAWILDKRTLQVCAELRPGLPLGVRQRGGNVLCR